MTFGEFSTKVDDLVREWRSHVLPRQQLEAIYLDVREEAIHGLAETLRHTANLKKQRDEALKQLHGHLVRKTESGKLK